MYRRPRRNEYYIKRRCDLPEVTIPAINTNPIVFRYVFSLNDLPNYSDFTNLYDSFRINSVKISFIPIYNSSDSTGSIVDRYVNRLFTALDYNDAPTPTDVNTVREYQNCKWTPYNRIHSRYIHVAPPPNSNGVTSSRRGAWINSANSSTNYFGLIGAMDPISSTADTIIYKVEAKYYCSFKTPK